jgi:hypothetical protein
VVRISTLAWYSLTKPMFSHRSIVEVALELSKRRFEPSTNHATPERRSKRPRTTSNTGPQNQKMVTRNRGKRTTSYLAIILAGRSRQKPLPQRKKRTTTGRPASTVARKFHGVVLPSLGRMSSRGRKRKRQESPQDSGGPPESDSDIDCPHEIDDGEGVVQLVVVNDMAKGECRSLRTPILFSSLVDNPCSK